MLTKAKAGGHEEDNTDGTDMNFEKFLNTNYSEEFMNGLPERIRQRAQVLLHYHEEHEKLCKDFDEKEKALRRKYDELYLQFFERRKAIVTGTSEPTEEEVAKGFPSEHEGKVEIKETAGDADKSVVGIPGFWLRVLQNHVLSNLMIEKHDEAVLSHLTDIRSGILEEGHGSFAVVFVFEPNEFFEEDSLMLGVVHKDDESRIIRSGPTWKPGKDVTVEKIRKKGGGKGGKSKKPLTVTVPRPSFFGCFKDFSNAAGDNGGGNDTADDEDFDDDEEEMNEQIEQLLHVLHNSIIPCAVNFYTGEAPDGSSDMETDDDVDYGDDDDEEEEEEERPVWKGKKPESGGGGKQPKECKQQ